MATSSPWLLPLWFLYYVKLEEIADFEAFKKYMLIGFGGLGVATCIYLKDYLSIRGLAVFLLLLAKLTCDTGRWVETPLRLIVITWAYVWIIVGMWWTISPWRGRDWLEWNVSDLGRLKQLSIARLPFPSPSSPWAPPSSKANASDRNGDVHVTV